jgi:hypothetical protein
VDQVGVNSVGVAGVGRALNGCVRGRLVRGIQPPPRLIALDFALPNEPQREEGAGEAEYGAQYQDVVEAGQEALAGRVCDQFVGR